MALISNDHLYYVFEGLSDDGKYYIEAQMPTSVEFLPKDPPQEFEGYTEKFLYEDYSQSGKVKKRYKHYVSSIATRLDQLKPDQFHPDLTKFEQLISSLKID